MKTYKRDSLGRFAKKQAKKRTKPKTIYYSEFLKRTRSAIRISRAGNFIYRFIWITLIAIGALGIISKELAKSTPRVDASDYQFKRVTITVTKKEKEVETIPDNVGKTVLDTESEKEIQDLTEYLQSVKSPYADKSEYMYNTSKEYGLDYRIMVSIFGQESSFGKVCWRFNCYGWGITDSGITTAHQDWSSFEAGWNTWLEGFSKQYADKDINEISYAGYNTRESWRNAVNTLYNNL